MKRNSSVYLKSCAYTFSKCVYLVFAISVAIQFYGDMHRGSVIDKDIGQESDDVTNDYRDLPVRTNRSQ